MNGLNDLFSQLKGGANTTIEPAVLNDVAIISPQPDYPRPLTPPLSDRQLLPGSVTLLSPSTETHAFAIAVLSEGEKDPVALSRPLDFEAFRSENRQILEQLACASRLFQQDSAKLKITQFTYANGTANVVLITHDVDLQVEKEGKFLLNGKIVINDGTSRFVLGNGMILMANRLSNTEVIVALRDIKGRYRIFFIVDEKFTHTSEPLFPCQWEESEEAGRFFQKQLELLDASYSNCSIWKCKNFIVFDKTGAKWMFKNQWELCVERHSIMLLGCTCYALLPDPHDPDVVVCLSANLNDESVTLRAFKIGSQKELRKQILTIPIPGQPNATNLDVMRQFFRSYLKEEDLQRTVIESYRVGSRTVCVANRTSKPIAISNHGNLIIDRHLLIATFIQLSYLVAYHDETDSNLLRFMQFDLERKPWRIEHFSYHLVFQRETPSLVTPIQRGLLSLDSPELLQNTDFQALLGEVPAELIPTAGQLIRKIVHTSGNSSDQTTRLEIFLFNVHDPFEVDFDFERNLFINGKRSESTYTEDDCQLLALRQEASCFIFDRDIGANKRVGLSIYDNAFDSNDLLPLLRGGTNPTGKKDPIESSRTLDFEAFKKENSHIVEKLASASRFVQPDSSKVEITQFTYANETASVVLITHNVNLRLKKETFLLDGKIIKNDTYGTKRFDLENGMILMANRLSDTEVIVAVRDIKGRFRIFFIVDEQFNYTYEPLLPCLWEELDERGKVFQKQLELLDASYSNCSIWKCQNFIVFDKTGAKWMFRNPGELCVEGHNIILLSCAYYALLPEPHDPKVVVCLSKNNDESVTRRAFRTGSQKELHNQILTIPIPLQPNSTNLATLKQFFECYFREVDLQSTVIELYRVGERTVCVGNLTSKPIAISNHGLLIVDRHLLSATLIQLPYLVAFHDENDPNLLRFIQFDSERKPWRVEHFSYHLVSQDKVTSLVFPHQWELLSLNSRELLQNTDFQALLRRVPVESIPPSGQLVRKIIYTSGNSLDQTTRLEIFLFNVHDPFEVDFDFERTLFINGKRTESKFTADDCQLLAVRQGNSCFIFDRDMGSDKGEGLSIFKDAFDSPYSFLYRSYLQFSTLGTEEEKRDFFVKNSSLVSGTISNYDYFYLHIFKFGNKIYRFLTTKKLQLFFTAENLYINLIKEPISFNLFVCLFADQPDFLLTLSENNIHIKYVGNQVKCTCDLFQNYPGKWVENTPFNKQIDFALKACDGKEIDFSDHDVLVRRCLGNFMGVPESDIIEFKKVIKSKIGVDSNISIGLTKKSNGYDIDGIGKANISVNVNGTIHQFHVQREGQAFSGLIFRE